MDCKSEFQSNVFDDVRHEIVLVLCIVVDENRERCIFPILPVIMKICRQYTQTVRQKNRARSTLPNPNFLRPGSYRLAKVCKNYQNLLPLNFIRGTSLELSKGGSDEYKKTQISKRLSTRINMSFSPPPPSDLPKPPVTSLQIKSGNSNKLVLISPLQSILVEGFHVPLFWVLLFYDVLLGYNLRHVKLHFCHFWGEFHVFDVHVICPEGHGLLNGPIPEILYFLWPPIANVKDFAKIFGLCFFLIYIKKHIEETNIDPFWLVLNARFSRQVGLLGRLKLLRFSLSDINVLISDDCRTHYTAKDGEVLQFSFF